LHRSDQVHPAAPHEAWSVKLSHGAEPPWHAPHKIAHRAAEHDENAAYSLEVETPASASHAGTAPPSPERRVASQVTIAVHAGS
jgi:hypothetical protein